MQLLKVVFIIFQQYVGSDTKTASFFDTNGFPICPAFQFHFRNENKLSGDGEEPKEQAMSF